MILLGQSCNLTDKLIGKDSILYFLLVLVLGVASNAHRRFLSLGECATVAAFGNFRDAILNSVPVGITRIIRRMRGGSQARLVLGDDSLYYVAKFAGNPQGNRCLVNECFAGQVLKQMGISTPNLRVLRLPQALESEDLCFQVGSKRLAPQGRLHLGSQSPVNPETTMILDFLPCKLLPKVVNLTEFAAMLVFDKWVAQTDSRQAIFVRDRSLVRDIGFRAYFIDHGMSFNGAEWQLRDAPVNGIYFRREVYSNLDLEALIEKAVCRLETISEAFLLGTLDGIPSAWLATGDRESFVILIGKLQQRQPKLRSIVSRHLKAVGLPTPGSDDRTFLARV